MTIQGSFPLCRIMASACTYVIYVIECTTEVPLYQIAIVIHILIGTHITDVYLWSYTVSVANIVVHTKVSHYVHN